MKLNLKAEKSGAAWGWRFLLGPATMIDGFAHLVSVGTLAVGAGLAVARRLSRARMAAEQGTP